MSDDDPNTWRALRRTLALNEQRMASYERVMKAEEILEEERRRRGISADAYDAAQIVDPRTGEEESEDLARLARSVAALGGRLEVNAVFPDGTIRLLSEPEI